jgi:hypothetical protein
MSLPPWSSPRFFVLAELFGWLLKSNLELSLRGKPRTKLFEKTCEELKAQTAVEATPLQKLRAPLSSKQRRSRKPRRENVLRDFSSSALARRLTVLRALSDQSTCRFY